MNLDELKIQLNEEAENKVRKQTNFADLLKRATHSPVNSIRKNLRTEIIISILFTAMCLYVSLANSYWSMRMYFGIFAFVGVGFIIVLSYLLRRTKQLQSQSLNMKENLKEIVNIIETYVRNYFRFSIALMPISIGLALYLSLSDQNRTYDRITDMGFIIPFGVFVVGLCVAIYFFNKWFLRKLYGQYTEKLKKNIRELEAEE